MEGREQSRHPHGRERLPDRGAREGLERPPLFHRAGREPRPRNQLLALGRARAVAPELTIAERPRSQKLGPCPLLDKELVCKEKGPTGDMLVGPPKEAARNRALGVSFRAP